MILKKTYGLILSIGLAMLLSACSSSDGGGGGGAGGGINPPITPAAPQPIVLQGVLSGDQEVPAVATGGSGSSTVTVSADGSTVDYVIDIDGPLSSDITMAHVHTGAVGANGPIMLWLCTNLGNAPAGIPAPPVCPQPPVTLSGSLTSADLDAGAGLANFADAVAVILNLNSYINVHTVNVGGGELRGQVGFTPPGSPPIPPAASDPVGDTYAWLGNTPLTIPAGQGILSNDPVGAAINASDAATSGGGQVTVNADGSFTYTPALAFRGADTFTYSIDGSTNPATVTIQLNALAWYADNNAALGGDGSFNAPFSTLLQAQTLSAVGDTVYLFSGNGTSAGQNVGFDFKANQSLIGQGVDFSFQAVPGSDNLIVAAGIAPMISRADVGDAGALRLANNNTVAGLQITSVTNEGIQVSAVGGFTIRDNNIDSTNREGIRLLNVTSGGQVMNNTITNPGREGISISNVEDLGGNPLTTDITAALSISGNTITAPVNNNHGFSINLGGVLTDVQITATSNTISGASQDGINANLVGSAALTAVLSGNTITGSATEGIDLQTNEMSSLTAGVDGNDMSANNGVADFTTQANGTSTVCLELTNNVNAALNSTFSLQNLGATSIFQIFESGNDTPAVRGVGDPFVDVVQGACGLP